MDKRTRSQHPFYPPTAPFVLQYLKFLPFLDFLAIGVQAVFETWAIRFVGVRIRNEGSLAFPFCWKPWVQRLDFFLFLSFYLCSSISRGSTVHQLTLRVLRCKSAGVDGNGHDMAEHLAMTAAAS